MEFLNFSEISSKIPFKAVLDWLNLPYTETQKGELKGEGFIITVSKNLYLNPAGSDKGSIINFLSHHKGIDLRTAAQELKNKFLTEPKEPVRELPNLELHYCKFLEDRGISQELAKELEIGLVKQHSIIAGRLAFKTYDEAGKHSGYVAYNTQKDEWFFPKGFRRTLWGAHRANGPAVVLTVDLFSAIERIKEGEQAVCLVGKTMTDTQAEQLERYECINLIHPEPDNIVVRLSKKSFVKSSPS